MEHFVEPTVNKAQAHAAEVYKNMGLEGTSQRELIAGVIRRIISNTYQAKDAYAARAIDQLCDINEKTFQILSIMRSEMADYVSLPDEEAAKTAKTMVRIFTDTLERLANVLAQKEPEKAFDMIIADLKPVYNAWLPPGASVSGSGTVIDAN